MGIDAAGHNRPKKQQNTGTITWTVIAVLSLGTVLAVWLSRAESQPSSVFGKAGGVAVLAVALLASIVAAASRGARRGLRWTLAMITLALALCVEILALAHFAAVRGAGDTAFGAILSAAVVAMVALFIGLLRGRPN